MIAHPSVTEFVDDGQSHRAPSIAPSQDSGKGEFQTFVESYQAEIFALLFALLGDASQAERTAQQVFVEAHRYSRRVWHRLPNSLWLYRTAVRFSFEGIASGVCRIAGRRREARRLLQGLSDDDRLLIILRDVQDYSVPRLSGIFGANEGQIRQGLLRVRRRALNLKMGRDLCHPS